MKLADAIAQHIIDVHEGDNWTEINIKNTLSDVSAAEAVIETNFTPNTIAALLCHITFYSNIAIERLKGNDPAINERNGFDVPAITNEHEWTKLKEDNREIARKLAAAVREFDEANLYKPLVAGGASAYKTLHGIAEHAH